MQVLVPSVSLEGAAEAKETPAEPMSRIQLFMAALYLQTVLMPRLCCGQKFKLPAHPDWQQTFDPAIDYKHNFCVAAENALETLRQGTPEDPKRQSVLRNALRGMNLSTAWPPPEGYEPPGLLEGDSTGAITDGGVMAQIFEELAIRAGFHWRDFYGYVDIPDAPEYANQTWNELLTWSR